MNKNNNDTVQSVKRALNIMEELSEERSLGITDIGKRVGMSKSTVHRLVGTLCDSGYVTQDGDGRYRLSLKLFDLGNRLVNQHGIRREATLYLERLARMTHETVNLAILENDQLVYIDRIESVEPLRIGLEIGRGYSAHCTALGKAWLAFLPDEEFEAFLVRQKDLERLTTATIIDKEGLRTEIYKIRREGVALEREEYRQGIHCVAAPVFNYNGRIAAAVSVSGPSVRMADGVLAERIDQVKEIARLISARVGFKGHGHRN